LPTAQTNTANATCGFAVLYSALVHILNRLGFSGQSAFPAPLFAKHKTGKKAVPPRCLSLLARSLIFVFLKAANAQNPRKKNEGSLWRACVAAGGRWPSAQNLEAPGGSRADPCKKLFPPE